MRQCPGCNKSDVVDHRSIEQYRYKDTELNVETEYSACNICGDELLYPDQIERNDRRLIEAYLATKKYAPILKYKKSKEQILNKQYDERDIIALDRAGGYYIRHVSAMTEEKLHDKSEIAAELAYRDWKIDDLLKQLAECKATVDSQASDLEDLYEQLHWED